MVARLTLTVLEMVVTSLLACAIGQVSQSIPVTVNSLARPGAYHDEGLFLLVLWGKGVCDGGKFESFTEGAGCLKSLRG